MNYQLLKSNDQADEYGWITENHDAKDYLEYTRADVETWVDDVISTLEIKSNAIDRIEQCAATKTYPCYGFTTGDTLEDEEAYIVYYTQDFEEQIAQERDEAIDYILDWIAQAKALMITLTVTEVENEFGLSTGTVRQYLKNHGNEMQKRGVARKSGATWLIHRAEAERIWGRHKQS